MSITINETPARRATAAERRVVHDTVRHWQREFYLDILTINVLFHDYPDDADNDDEGAAARMDCDAVDTYHYVTLHVFPRFFDGDSEDQREMLAHEMLHPITWLLTNLAVRLGEGQLVTGEDVRLMNERVTNWLTRIIVHGGNARQSERPIRVKKAPVKKKPKAKR